MAKLFDEKRAKGRGKRSAAEIQRRYVTPNSGTSIPRRASASGSAKIRPRHPRSYTDTKFLDISELVTNPPPIPAQPHRTGALHDERSIAPRTIDAVVAADTVMSNALTGVPSLSSAADMDLHKVEDVVDVVLAVRARELLHRRPGREDRPAFIHNPVDYMRWWLLFPGRLEFLFWLGGAVLLGVLICVLLLVTGLGLGFMSMGHSVH